MSENEFTVTFVAEFVELVNKGAYKRYEESGLSKCALCCLGGERCKPCYSVTRKDGRDGFYQIKETK